MLAHHSRIELMWLAIGFAGQFLFSLRFILQWLQSEIEKKSVIPVTFWYFSILGGLTLLAYAIYRKDPVFIIGQAFGIFIYFRNLQLLVKINLKERILNA